MRRKKGEMTKLKEQLWELCKNITRATYGNVCYTCGKTGLFGGNWQTGHFLTKSTCSTEVAYDLKNLRPQCYHCNINLSGNWQVYEDRLIAAHGKRYVSELKKRNQQTKGGSYGSWWFRQKIQEYEEKYAQFQV